MRREEFDRIANEAFRRIPARFRRRLENVLIVVEDEPSPRHLTAGRVRRGYTLFGLYEGRPLTVRSVSDSFAPPDRITLFQGPIERAARSYSHLEELIEGTLWHEIAHYFGMDEAQVRAAEKRRKLARQRQERRRE